MVAELRGLLVSGVVCRMAPMSPKALLLVTVVRLALLSCRPVALGEESVSVTKSLPSLGRAVAEFLPWCD